MNHQFVSIILSPLTEETRDECLKLQVSFRKRATNYGSLIQKMSGEIILSPLTEEITPNFFLHLQIYLSIFLRDLWVTGTKFTPVKTAWNFGDSRKNLFKITGIPVKTCWIHGSRYYLKSDLRRPWSWMHPLLFNESSLDTVWRMPCKLQVSFRKRATDYMALMQKVTCKDKASYESSPTCKWSISCCLLIVWPVVTQKSH